MCCGRTVGVFKCCAPCRCSHDRLVSCHSVLHLVQKQFYTFQRFKAGAWNNQNSRLENLLGKLAIKGRFVTDGNFDNVPPIDYDKALALLEAERAASLRYLSSSLKD